MNGRLLIRFSRLQNRGRKFRLIWRVGIVLRFETQRSVLVVSTGAFAAIEKVAAIKLHARLSCVKLHHATAGRLLDARGQRQRAVLAAQHKTVIVTHGVGYDLFQSLANPMRRTKIEWSSLHIRQCTGWDQAIVDRQGLVRLALQLVILLSSPTPTP